MLLTHGDAMKTRKTVWAMNRPCSRCGQADPAEFYAGGSAWCKRCHKDAVLRGRLKKKGITPEDEARALMQQGDCCAICLAHKDKFTRSLHMDHCHKTGKARAVLCHRCNQTLGHAEDDPVLLRAMADYIERYT